MKLDDISSKNIYYLSYGMLTNPHNMPEAEFIGPAVVKNFKFEMLAYANVVPSPGDEVHGVLWLIDKKTLKRLDRIEGYPTMYGRKSVPVYTDGAKFSAEIYIMTPETRDYLQDERPDREYVRSILDGYKQGGVPLSQIRQAVNDLYNRHINKNLNEVNMSPSALKDFAKSPVAKNMIVGFEAEIIVPDLESSNYEDFDPDYSMDMSVPTDKNWITTMSEWLMGGDNPNYQPNVRRAMNEIDQDVADYIEDALQNYLNSSNGNKVVHQLIAKARGDDDSRVIARDIYTQNEWWDHAVDTIRQDFYNRTNYVAEYLDYKGIKTMKDIVQDYGLGWPYYDMKNNGTITFKDLADDFKLFTGYTVVASGEYHGVERRPGQWIIEPDNSLEDETGLGAGAEVISPPMPFQDSLKAINKFWKWADRTDAWTNDSCGFHIGVSIGGQSKLAIDPIKLVLFLGDEHILKTFGRQLNQYSQSALKSLKKSVEHDTPRYIDVSMGVIKQGVNKIATDFIIQGMLERTNRYLSVSVKNNYVEFRSAGGNYLDQKKLIVSTLLRYVRAMAIAADPNAEREEYLKKIYKLFNENKTTQSKDSIDMFAKFVAGDIDLETLKHELYRKHSIDTTQ